MRRALLFVAVLVLLAPASALARRAVSGAAKDPLVHAALGSKVPRQCAAVYISTVNTLWGDVSFRPATGWRARCAPFAANGWTVLHHARGRWRTAWSGSAIPCPIPHTPVAVARDLRIICYPLIP